MACDHHNMTESFYVGLKHFRLVFLFVYVIEFVLKLIALSCLGYFKEGWNIFEFVIVFFGLLSHALESVLGLALLSVTNLLILFRLGRFWPTYNNTLRMMSRTTSVLLVFLLIIGSFLLIMASIGTSIFGSSYEANQYYFSDGIPRWHMMDYGHSFLLAFRCLCFEWVESLRDGMLVSGWSLFPFYFVLVVFGNFVLVNLFTVFQVAYIAIPYKNEEKDDKQVLIDNMSKTADRFVRLWKLLTSKIFRRQITYVRDFKERSQNTRISDANASIQVNGEDNSVINFDNSKNAFPELNQTTTVPETPENCCPNICYVCLPRNCGESPSFKKLREKCLWLINNIFFELVIIATVIINCALIVSRFEEFDKPSVTYKSLNYTLLVVFPLIFILETAIRLIGHGVKGYFSNGFRCWEFFFVIIYIVDAIALLAEMGHAPIAIIAISFRMFRLIGLTTRFEVARNVLNTFAEAFPGLMNVWIQGTFVWLIFAIMGVQMFGGKFYRCVDQFGDRVNATTIRDKYDCLMANLSWVNPDLHFDNVLDGYLSLSQVATFKGWINILHNAMDSKGVEDQPDEEVNFYMFVYFVLFIVCGSYFTYVMWFSVLIDAFNRQKRKTDEERNITSPEDELYYNAVKIMSSRNPNPPIKVSEGKNEAIVSSLPFDVLILILILLDVALLAMNHYQETESFSYGLTVTHAVFVTVYSIEIFLRALAQGFVPFLKKPTNLFDLAAILFIIIDLATANSISGNFLPPQFLRLGRVFDIISKYKWMKYFPGVRRIFSAGRKLLPYLGYLIFVETIIIFCYALMGVILWRDVRQFGPSGMFFNTLGESIVILSQIFVSSGWDGFLHPIMNERDCQQNENCGDKTTAILYLISFVTISYLVVMTLLTVLVQVMYSEAGDEELERLQNEQMDHFYRTWSQYDQDAKGYVDLNQLPSLLELQTNAFGFTKTSDSSVAPLDIPIVEGEKVHHRDVLDALFRWSLREKGIEVKNVEAFDQLTHPEPDYKPVSSTLWRKREENALAKIRKAWTQFKDQKL